MAQNYAAGIARGDIIYMDLGPIPKTAQELDLDHPCIVISKTDYSAKYGYAIVVPVTSTDHKNPLHIPVSKYGEPDLRGFIMVNNMKTVDMNGRPWNRHKVRSAPPEMVKDILRYVDLLMFSKPKMVPHELKFDKNNDPFAVPESQVLEFEEMVESGRNFKVAMKSVKPIADGFQFFVPIKPK